MTFFNKKEEATENNACVHDIRRYYDDVVGLTKNMEVFLREKIIAPYFVYYAENFTDSQKKKVMLHMADILYRRGMGWGDEKELSLGDVFLVCLAIELRKESEKKREAQNDAPREPLLTFLPDTLLTKAEKFELANRVAEYQLQYRPRITVNEDPKMLKDILLVNLMADKGVRKKLISRYNGKIDKSGTMINTRIKAFWLEESNYLAILYTASNPATTIENGQECNYKLLSTKQT